MIKHCILSTLLLSIFLCNSCKKTNVTGTQNQILFETTPIAFPLSSNINETSGIADSKTNTGYLWIEEDSGNPPQLKLVNHNGQVQKSIYIKGAINRDWEDMALSGNTVYIGDIGDNDQTQTEYSFYKFDEPGVLTDTVYNFQHIHFKYPDGSHDAEAFLVDPTNENIYIITKRDNASKIYKIAAPFNNSFQYTASFVGQLNFSGVVSAALSPDRKEILIKTYTAIYYYKVGTNESFESALQNKAEKVPYEIEQQGEAVCFAQKNDGYFTLSEKLAGPAVQLFFYKRK